MGRSRKGWNVRKTPSRRTSVRLEQELWAALGELARRQHKSVDDVTISLYSGDDSIDFTSVIRVYILTYWRTATEAAEAELRETRETLRELRCQRGRV